MILLPTVWENQKTLGECGCKSALINYSVTLLNEKESAKTVLQATISSLDKKEFNFIINPDSSINYNKNFEINISCQNPD